MIKDILVMGGSCFIGKKIVNVLLENSYNVYTLNRGKHSGGSEEAINIICDRNDTKNMKKALEKYNFDAVIDVSGFNRLQAEILYNSLNTDNIKKFIFISSSAVYDVDNIRPPYKEDTAHGRNRFWGDYGTDKTEAEDFYIEKLKSSNKSLIILRPPYAYGEDNYVQRESFIFDHICNEKPVIIPNDGGTYLQFIYTTDLAEIIVKLLKRTTENISVYNVGNKKPVTIREWVESCAMAAGRKVKVIEYDYKQHNRSERDFFPFYDYDNILDVSKINEIYDSETYFMDGLKYAYEWYSRNKEKIKFSEDIRKNEDDILRELGES